MEKASSSTTNDLTTENNGGPIRRSRPADNTRGRHGKRVTRFVFTLNNWTPEELEAIKTIDCRWLVVGKEISPTTGTPHLQGAVVLHAQKAYSQLTTLPGLKRAFTQEMNGSPEQSLVYCSKADSNYFEKGSLPKSGKRSDLVDVVEALKRGDSLAKMAQETTAAIAIIRYSRGITFLRTLYTHTRDTSKPPLVLWFWGRTGTGKTQTAWELCKDHPGHSDTFPWISSGSLRWFAGYDGQPCAIFDDLRTNHTDFAMLLRLLDRYPMSVEFKGGNTDWAPDVIVVTAPMDPRTMWNLRTDEQLGQLERRITRVLEFPISDDVRADLSESIRSRHTTLSPVPEDSLHLLQGRESIDRGIPMGTTGQREEPIIGSELELERRELDDEGSDLGTTCPDSPHSAWYEKITRQWESHDSDFL